MLLKYQVIDLSSYSKINFLSNQNLTSDLVILILGVRWRIDVEAETPILGPPDARSWLIWKNPNAGKDWGQEEKGITEDEMVGRHHWLNGHGFR